MPKSNRLRPCLPHPPRRLISTSPRAVLLIAWANAILEGRDDVAVVVNTQTLFPRTKCVIASNGQESRSGWPCIFAPMPHLCAFDDSQVGGNARRTRLHCTRILLYTTFEP